MAITDMVDMSVMAVIWVLFRVVALIDSEYAFHAANSATNSGANHRSDRAGDAVALMEAVHGASGNPLCLCGERHSERSDTRAANE